MRRFNFLICLPERIGECESELFRIFGSLPDDLELRLARAVPTRKVDIPLAVCAFLRTCARSSADLFRPAGKTSPPLSRLSRRGDGAIEPRLYAFRGHDVGRRYPADCQQERSGQRHEIQELGVRQEGKTERQRQEQDARVTSLNSSPDRQRWSVDVRFVARGASAPTHPDLSDVRTRRRRCPRDRILPPRTPGQGSTVRSPGRR